MNREQKLVSLLHPKDYKSKIKLFCAKKSLKTEKLVNKIDYIKDISYVCKVIKITEK